MAEDLETISENVESLIAITERWETTPEDLDRFNKLCSETIDEIQNYIYGKLSSENENVQEIISEDMWPQEMITLCNSSDESVYVPPVCEDLSNIAKDVFQSQTIANEIADEKSISGATLNQVTLKLVSSLECIEGERSPESEKIKM